MGIPVAVPTGSHELGAIGSIGLLVHRSTQRQSRGTSSSTHRKHRDTSNSANREHRSTSSSANRKHRLEIDWVFLTIKAVLSLAWLDPSLSTHVILCARKLNCNERVGERRV